MVMNLSVKTDVDDIMIDYIELLLQSGKTVCLDWDETNFDHTDNGLEAEYANVTFHDKDEDVPYDICPDEFNSCDISMVGIYSDRMDLGSVTITGMSFFDGEQTYCMDQLTPYEIPKDKIDRT